MCIFFFFFYFIGPAQCGCADLSNFKNELALQMSCTDPSEIKLGSKSVNTGLLVVSSLGGKKSPHLNLFCCSRSDNDLNSGGFTIKTHFPVMI